MSKLFTTIDKRLVDSITTIIEDELGEKCTTEAFFEILGKCLMGLTIQWAANLDKSFRGKALDLYFTKIRQELAKLNGEHA